MVKEDHWRLPVPGPALLFLHRLREGRPRVLGTLGEKEAKKNISLHF